jgi:hypothetical protein
MEKALVTTPLSRRKLLRNGLLTGLGAAAVGIVSPVFTGKAQAAVNVQQNWYWCAKCTGLFYSADSYVAGWCPAGGQHVGYNANVDSYPYDLYYNIPISELGPLYQESWNWCNKCAGLFYGPQQSSSWCPAGGRHNGTGSFNYELAFGGAIPAGYYHQDSWNWCRKCTGLFYGPQQSSSYCPAGGQHDGSGSYNYTLGWLYLPPP